MEAKQSISLLGQEMGQLLTNDPVFRCGAVGSTAYCHRNRMQGQQLLCCLSFGAHWAPPWRRWRLAHSFLLAMPTCSDITFCLRDGSEVQAHRAILAARCAYFRGALTGGGSAGGLREAAQRRLEVLHLDPAIFRLIVQWIYTDGEEGGRHPLPAYSAHPWMVVVPLPQLPPAQPAAACDPLPPLPLLLLLLQMCL